MAEKLRLELLCKLYIYKSVSSLDFKFQFVNKYCGIRIYYLFITVVKVSLKRLKRNNL